MNTDWKIILIHYYNIYIERWPRCSKPTQPSTNKRSTFGLCLQNISQSVWTHRQIINISYINQASSLEWSPSPWGDHFLLKVNDLAAWPVVGRVRKGQRSVALRLLTPLSLPTVWNKRHHIRPINQQTSRDSDFISYDNRVISLAS